MQSESRARMRLVATLLGHAACERLRRLGHRPLEFTRKFIHIGVGMSAEVVFAFGDTPQVADSLMVPMGAILSGEGQDFHVFRYDAGTSTVRRVPVEIEDLHDNAVQVAGDLAAGDIIATAGVEFLADGQEVRLMGREMPFGEGASS